MDPRVEMVYTVLPDASRTWYGNVRTMIVGLVGPKGVGKTTIARGLERLGWIRMSFSEPLKDVVAVAFGWPRGRLDGLTPEDRTWREQPDPFWSSRLGRPFSPRMALQQVGTDLFRERVHPDFWVVLAERRVAELDSDRDVVFDDVRFPNEARAIRNMGGVTIRLSRPDLVVDDRHPSETTWKSMEVDATVVVENDTKDVLFAVLHEIERIRRTDIRSCNGR